MFSELASIGSFVSGVAVLASLVFVAVQMRQNTLAVRAAASQAESLIYWQINQTVVTHADVARLWRCGCADPDSLTDDDWVRYVSFLSSAFRVFEGAQLEHRKGLLDKPHWDSLVAVMTDFAGQPGVKAFWALRRHRQSPEFQSWFETLLTSQDTAALYGRTAASPGARANG